MIESGSQCGFRPGEVVFQQGESSTGVYYLRSGVAKVVVATPDGREITLGYAGPGETIGEMSALEGSSRSATVIAMEPVEAIFIARDAFREAISHTPEAAMRLLQLLVRRLRAVDQMVANMESGHPEGPYDGLQSGVDLAEKLKQLQARIDQLGLTRENLDWYADPARMTILKPADPVTA
jgi:CRP-like cAMP-binding protein